ERIRAVKRIAVRLEVAGVHDAGCGFSFGRSLEDSGERAFTASPSVERIRCKEENVVAIDHRPVIKGVFIRLIGVGPIVVGQNVVRKQKGVAGLIEEQPGRAPTSRKCYRGSANEAA